MGWPDPVSNNEILQVKSEISDLWVMSAEITPRDSSQFVC